jgi:hypothetical protein
MIQIANKKGIEKSLILKYIQRAGSKIKDYKLGKQLNVN